MHMTSKDMLNIKICLWSISRENDNMYIKLLSYTKFLVSLTWCEYDQLELFDFVNRFKWLGRKINGNE